MPYNATIINLTKAAGQTSVLIGSTSIGGFVCAWAQANAPPRTDICSQRHRRNAVAIRVAFAQGTVEHVQKLGVTLARKVSRFALER